MRKVWSAYCLSHKLTRNVCFLFIWTWMCLFSQHHPRLLLLFCSTWRLCWKSGAWASPATSAPPCTSLSLFWWWAPLCTFILTSTTHSSPTFRYGHAWFLFHLKSVTFLKPVNQFHPSLSWLRLQSCSLLAIISYELLTFAIQKC